MIVRPLRQQEFEIARDLWNSSCQDDWLSADLFREKTCQDPTFEEDCFLTIEHQGRLLGLALGVTRPNTKRGHIKLLAVDEAFQRRGYGGRLLVALESRLRDRGCQELRVDEAAPNYLNPGVDLQQERAAQFFQAHGYVPFGETHHLRVELGGQDWQTEIEETELLKLGIRVRRAMATDQTGLCELLQAQWPAWMPEVARAFQNQPISLHLAQQGDQVIGFSAYDTNNLGLGWFGPMGTTPECRGLGVGRVLLRRCLSDQRQQGHRHAIIPWVGPIEFYARHASAVVWRTFRRMRKFPL